MKPVDVKDNTYIDVKKEINNKDRKFKVDDHVRISKYNNIFTKGHMPNWPEEILLRKLKILCHGHILLMILMVKKLLVHFMKMYYKTLSKKEFRIEKLLKKKGDKLYVKWKSYDNSFNSWIDKKDIV